MLANKVRTIAASNLQKQYRLIPFGTGGQMMYQIEKLMLIFNYPKPLNEDEARELLINSVEEFLAVINAEQAIHPYLANFPFEPKNVEVTVHLQDLRGNKVQPESFVFVQARDHFIYFEDRDPETGYLRIAHEEPFAEAEKIVKQKNQWRNL